MESRKSARASPRLRRPLISKIVASAVSRILIFRLIAPIPFPRTLSLKFLDGCHVRATAPVTIGSGSATPMVHEIAGEVGFARQIAGNRPRKKLVTLRYTISDPER